MDLRSLPALGLVLLIATAAEAQDEQVYLEHERYGAWEMALHASRVGGFDATGITDSVLDADSGTGWGVSLGYNFNNQFSLGFNMMGASHDYVEVNPAGNRHELDLTMGMLAATWHFRPERFTPYVTLGAGWRNIDSNIASGREERNCWWDAWWGRQCSTSYATYNETRASGRAALGLRWDFHRQFFARASVGQTWLDLGKTSSTPTVVRFEIGLRR